MFDEYLSIKEGKIREIQLIKYLHQCPYCGNPIDQYDDTEMNLLTIVCGFCGKKYRIALDDYTNIPRSVQNDV